MGSVAGGVPCAVLGAINIQKDPDACSRIGVSQYSFKMFVHTQELLGWQISVLWSNTEGRERWEFRRCTGNILLIAVIKQWLTGHTAWSWANEHWITIKSFLLLNGERWNEQQGGAWAASSQGGLAIILMFCCPCLPFGCFWEEPSICHMSWLPAHPQDKKKHVCPNEPTRYHLWVPTKCRTRCLS